MSTFDWYHSSDFEFPEIRLIEIRGDTFKRASREIEFIFLLKMLIAPSKIETQNFKPLRSCQRLLSYISVCPPEKDTKKFTKLLFKVSPLIIVITVSMALTASILYFLRFHSINLETSLNSLFQVVGLLGLTYSILVTLFTHQKLLAMFVNLEKLYRACKRINS